VKWKSDGWRREIREITIPPERAWTALMLRQYRADTRILNQKVAICSNNEPSKADGKSNLLVVDEFLPRSLLITITPAMNNAIATKRLAHPSPSQFQPLDQQYNKHKPSHSAHYDA
jgi:hypothetical protein